VLKLIGKTPDEVTLDIDWGAVRSRSGERERSGERRGRERGGASRDRAESAKREVAEALVPPTANATEIGTEAADRPVRAPRRPRADPPARTAPREARPPQREEREDGNVVRGFGADIPAFLQRVPPRFGKSASED
jgi:hypothetical protein